MHKFRRAVNCSLIFAGMLLAVSCYAQATATTPTASPPKESQNHNHKHQLPTEVPIPHRLEPVATQAHPEQAKQRQKRAETLPQK